LDFTLNFPFPKKIWQGILLVNTIPEVVGLTLVKDLYSIGDIMSYVLFCALLVGISWWIEQPIKEKAARKKPAKKQGRRKR